MEKIDLESWSRRPQWEFFKNTSFPFYHVSFYVEVTPVADWAKLHSVSFYHSMCYLVSASMNEIENFRYRIRGDEVWLPDECHPSLTVLRPGTTEFQILNCRMQPSLEAFCERAASLWNLECSQPRHDGDMIIGDKDIPNEECFFISCLPWLDLTGISSERVLDPADSIPRIGWGQYRKMFRGELREKLWLTVSVDVNHRLVDGYHIGAFAAALNERISNL